MDVTYKSLDDLILEERRCCGASPAWASIYLSLGALFGENADDWAVIIRHPSGLIHHHQSGKNSPGV
ncbi:Uncharacterized protein APZ42_033117 [Daphnia magna]|uniref:Uncharacterized protein n=1 Tax=Daphnia magna TaxID=35525 RepID=A0A164LD40_9CRUS|nr:Uncharacterized protein APZ42_033117 [Daphnia magna]